MGFAQEFLLPSTSWNIYTDQSTIMKVVSSMAMVCHYDSIIITKLTEAYGIFSSDAKAGQHWPGMKPAVHVGWDTKWCNTPPSRLSSSVCFWWNVTKRLLIVCLAVDDTIIITKIFVVKESAESLYLLEPTVYLHSQQHRSLNNIT